MDLDEIRQILQLMEENGLAEFELERDGLRIALRKAVAGVPVITAVPQAVAAAPAQSAAEVKDEGKFAYVTSPMVGTFYVAPSPDSPPFVNIGDAVTKDTVVCILEAMKVMNEIKAEIEGTIVEVLVENAEPVEYGEPLFRVEVA
ncbi:MAG: acetyl-CoA carboxylase biotin carboxyl carrier protein [Verrucomicrobia bacterium]|nr:acetyl-CoA carboxylase biotin carboxyl carrier protein [Verrucomicrobiota bacterium]